ncbi:MAG: hypothetical protein HND52_18430 [Ignavibacteriae bacterium]|nr:hypothetical protein [Ignavibacteriota bacterium]
MPKKLITLLLLFLLGSAVYAQKNEKVLFLKNGSIIHGQILELSTDSTSTITFESTDGNIFVIELDEVAKIIYSDLNDSMYVYSNVSKLYNIMRTGLGFIASLSKYELRHPLNEPILEIGIIFGYRMNDLLNVGLGFEYNKYPDRNVVPIYLDVRTNIFLNRVMPILFVDIGYSLTLGGQENSSTGEGIILNIGTGIEFMFSYSKSLLIELSFRQQWTKLNEFRTFEDFFGQVFLKGEQVSVANNFVSIMVGFKF